MATRVIHPVKYGSVQLDGIRDLNVMDGTAVQRTMSDGNIEAFRSWYSGASAMIGVTSYSLKAALDLVGLSSIKGAVQAWEALKGDDGSKSGTNALRHDAATALTTIGEIAWSQDSEATITLMSRVYGTELSTATGASLESFTPGSSNSWGVGPGCVSVNGTTIDEVSSVRIGFGVTVVPNRNDGGIVTAGFDVFGILPVIRIVTRNTALRSIATGGSGPYGGVRALSGNGCRVYFRKTSSTGYVATGTASHVLVGAANGTVRCEDTRGRQGGRNELAIVVEPHRTSGVASLTFNTATAIA